MVAETKQVVRSKVGTEMSDYVEMLNAAAEGKLEALKIALSIDLAEANFRIVKARVRGGKIQRKRKVSTRPGYTIRGGKLVRMSSSERMRRKRGSRKGKTKRKAKLARSMMKRKRSLRKRRSLGV
jgi:hypothetical protein